MGKNVITQRESTDFLSDIYVTHKTWSNTFFEFNEYVQVVQSDSINFFTHVNLKNSQNIYIFFLTDRNLYM